MRFKACALGVLLLQVADVVPHVAGIGGLIVIIAVFPSAGHDGPVGAPIRIDRAAHVVAARLAARHRDGADVEIIGAGFGIKQNHVVLARKIGARASAGLISPDDLVEKIVFAEYIVHQQPQMRIHVAVDVQENRALFFQKLAGKREHIAHHGQILLAALPPVVISRQG